ncbi:MAG: SDR family oxidoreductase [Rhizobiaceae bacterium]|nr:SDR family oxidoreductase [Rhizobiaceae bacterium]
MTGLAIVTGATGSIGEATVARLMVDGWTVLSADVSPPKDAAKHPNFVQLDVTSAHSVTKLFEAVAPLGEVQALVINHGILEPTSAATYDEDVVQKTLEVNLKGSLRVLQAVAPHMRSPASIVLTSSVTASIGGIQGSYIYQATKAGLEQITRHFAVALGLRGIRVNAVAPGMMADPMRGSGAKVRAATHTAGVTRSRDNPLGRPVIAAEVANVIAFLCSDEASAVDGIVLRVDCGLLAV